jgi:hypothetical protein
MPMSSLFFPCYADFASLLSGNLSLFRDQGNNRKHAFSAMTYEHGNARKSTFFPVNSLRTGKNPPRNREDAAAQVPLDRIDEKALEKPA